MNSFAGVIRTIESRDSDRRIDKSALADSFGRAAATYDESGRVQQLIGDMLLEKLSAETYASILDVGCGTGRLTGELSEKQTTALIVGMDLSPAMILYAVDNRSSAAEYWCVGDMESMPFADNCFSLIFSSLAMQWLESPERWFKSAYRLLKPGGRLLCSTLLPSTLWELREAWRNVDGYVHVNHFIDSGRLSDAAESVGLIGSVEGARIERCLPSVRDITAELKGIGARNLNPNRPTGLTGKEKIKRFLAEYEGLRKPEGLPVTYNVAICDYRKLG